MKKFFLCAVAVLAAGVMSAAVVDVDLSTGQQINNTYPV